MKVWQVSVRLVALLGVVCLGLLGSGVARGQAPAISNPSCSLSAPNFVPDFSSNQNCLTPNGTAAFAKPAGANPFGTVNPAPQPPPANVSTVLRLTTNNTGQAGSAWFVTQQPVAGAFSTTFATFQMSNTNGYVADGFAFVIQNSPASQGGATTALGLDGCAIGFADDPTGSCANPTGGIPNSVAIEFNTYLNGGQVDTTANSVAIQSCGVNPNSIDTNVPAGAPTCTIGVNNSLPITLADGNVHTVTVTYTPPASGSGPGTLDVILDNNDLFPAANSQAAGVAFDMTTLGLTNGTAYVGFTAATGGGDADQDILS